MEKGLRRRRPARTAAWSTPRQRALRRLRRRRRPPGDEGRARL